jgi:HK97 family phage prohead protease
MNFEKRIFIANAELRAQADFVVTGKAVSYNKLSPDNQLGDGVREKVAPGAFADSIRQGGYQGDVICTVNHNDDRVLGRLSNGTLTLNDSPDALRFHCQLDKNNPDHVAAHASIKRGDLSQCSFQFVNTRCDWMDDTDTAGNPCQTRVIQKADLLDVSIVTRPFYSLPGSTDAQARAAEARAKAQQNGARAEAIAKFRQITRLLAEPARKAFIEAAQRDGAVGGADGGDEMALVREHLSIAHEMQECAHAMSGTARNIMDCWDWDDDPDDPDSRRNTHDAAWRKPLYSGDAQQPSKRSPYAPYGDPDDLRCFRELHKKAHEAMEACCEHLARCRLKQPAKK